MPRKSSKATETTTTMENDEMASTEGPQITVGVSAPTRTRNGAGRSRGDNPFDGVMEDLYASGEWAGVPFSTEDEEKNFKNLLKNAAQHAGYGLDMGVDPNEPGVLKFHVRDKVQGRGRKPGSKKVDGKFYNPSELDDEGNPTAEARAAKESAE